MIAPAVEQALFKNLHLSAKERMLLSGLALCWSNQQLAAYASLQVQTVEWNKRELVRKLQLTSSRELLAYAVLASLGMEEG